MNNSHPISLKWCTWLAIEYISSACILLFSLLSLILLYSVPHADRNSSWAVDLGTSMWSILNGITVLILSDIKRRNHGLDIASKSRSFIGVLMTPFMLFQGMLLLWSYFMGWITSKEEISFLLSGWSFSMLIVWISARNLAIMQQKSANDP